jgi:endonuclease/exonuclease/phosphatase (EEP) superfamily protein YafD
MLNWSEFRGAVLTLGGLLVLVMAIIIVQPGLPGELLLQSLRFHFVAVGLGLGLLLVLAGARWRGALLLLVVVVFGLHAASYLIEFQARRVEHAGPPLAEFEFLSFNVLADNPRSAELVEAIVANPPDVALIMETPGVEAYLSRLAEVLPYRIGCASSETCDISLHSRFPLEAGAVMDLLPLGRERVVTGRIVVDGQPVTIVGVHLTKPYYDNTADIELYRVDGVLRGIEGPVVLAGDFNSASWFEPMSRVGRRHGLTPGPSQPATWPVRLGPLGVPIDNVFTRGTAQLITLEAGENYGSNHRPLWARVGLYGAD